MAPCRRPMNFKQQAIGCGYAAPGDLRPGAFELHEFHELELRYNPLITMENKPKFTRAAQRRRVTQILRGLNKAYPDAHCALKHTGPLELLVATILSAQCTDERVNLVTRDLFRKYRAPKDYVDAPSKVLEAEIRSTGFYRNKTRSIQGACRMILDKFDGRIPDTMEKLIQLPGVARKTANVVLGVAYGKAEGIVVDTHVFRVSRRLELTAAETPEKVELDLIQLIPKQKWIAFSHQMIHHGRKTCKARKPLCHLCTIEKVCRSKEKVMAFPLSNLEPPGRRARTAQ